MGLQVRKRTKGKNAWFNFSASKKNGASGSVSIRLNDKMTYNTRGRLTVNLGNGVRYVAYKKKKKPVKKPEVKNTNTPKTESWLRRAFNALESAADKHYEAEQQKKQTTVQSTLSFEDKAKAIAEKQAIRARALQEARGKRVTYVNDEETGFTIGQKRFMLLSLFVVIFIIQKCSG